MRTLDVLHAIKIQRGEPGCDLETADRIELRVLLEAIHDEENRQHGCETRLLDLEGRAAKVEKRLGIPESQVTRLKHEWDADQIG